MEFLILVAMGLAVIFVIAVIRSILYDHILEMPDAVYAAHAKLNPEMQEAFGHDYVRRRKSLLLAYIAWLLLGWHYLYLGKVGLQFAFWFTAGGFFVWWFLDLFRLPGVVARHNDDVALQLMAQYRMIA